jgi:membrane dipeptidase
MMSRSRFAPAILLMFSFTAYAQSPADAASPSPKKTAKTTKASADWKHAHATAIVVDTHADTPGRFVDEKFDPGTPAGTHGHWDLAAAKRGNLGAEFFSIWVDPDKYKGQYAHRAFDMIDSVYETVRQHPDEMVMAKSSKDIIAARAEPHKRIAVLMGVEGGHAIENDVRILRDYYRLGVRYMTLTWANTNELGQSSGDLKKDPATGKIIDDGLTDFGRSIVTEMNRLGMIVDISHVSDRSFYNALTLSQAQVIASHSSARVLTDVPRNMSDEMLKQLALYNGGVVQVNFNCGFISSDYNAQMKKYSNEHPAEFKRYSEIQRRWEGNHDPELEKQMRTMEDELHKTVKRPPLSALIDHIDHIAKIAGVEHVGIGSDFDGVDCLPEGIDSVGDLPKISEELAERGYSAKDIQMILGGNLLRVFADVERVAREMETRKSSDNRQEMKLPDSPK